MPRRSILSAAERESLLALPDAKDDLIRYYTFSESDLSIIRQRRGPANRLGFAVQLCYLRFPGVILGVDEPPFRGIGSNGTKNQRKLLPSTFGPFFPCIHINIAIT
jgi:TnpA family transposase